MVEKETQTIQVESSSEESSSESDEEEIKVEMKDQATETDEIPKEEKGVNTRSRSLQSLSSHRRSPAKDGSDTDNSLAARRRRRRERAQTTTIQYAGGSSFDAGDNNEVKEDPGQATYPGRRPRSRFLPKTTTIDNADMYSSSHADNYGGSNM